LKSLGKRLKYSSAYYPPGCQSLDEAEEAMLNIYVARAQIKDGMNILDLGCGWGSFSLFICEKFPNVTVTSVSHSSTQRSFIEKRRSELKIGAKRLQIVTCDINRLELPTETFDRVVSIEMFEHMKNYEVLLERVASWMKADAKLFVHIFTHKDMPYHFLVRNESDWMAKYFFTGGTMPSDDLLLYFQKDLKIENHWIVNGTHYGKTSEDWLKILDKNAAYAKRVFAETYGKANAVMWYVRWRLFYLACAELWSYDNGEEWFVSHYLFSKPPLQPQAA